jgi:MoaA/NifB/PqqE/SkfB family radical SAM enzyme
MVQAGQSRLRKSNYAAFENYLVAKYERLAGITKVRSYPYIMSIDPCNICQLRCPACMTGMLNEVQKKKHIKNTHRPPSRLSKDVLESIYDECGDVLFYCYFYNWGEPLLNKNLPYYIRCARDRDIYTKFDSNLSVKCGDGMLEELLLAGLDEISASIDGFSQQTYEKYRVGGRLDVALRNLEKLVEIRDRLGCQTKIRWKCLVYSFNEHELGDIAAFCQERNIDFVAADAVILPTNPDWVPTYRREGKPNPYYRPNSRSNLPTPAGQLPAYPGRPEGRTCAWHYSYAVVHADGAVAPCCGPYSRKSDFGQVTAEPGSFGKVWNGKNFEIVRRDFPQGKETVAINPTTTCTRCTRSEAYRDHYTMLDREVIFKYWSLEPDSSARQLDQYFILLQKSPSRFAAAYAARYGEQHGTSEQRFPAASVALA